MRGGCGSGVGWVWEMGRFDVLAGLTLFRMDKKDPLKGRLLHPNHTGPRLPKCIPSVCCRLGKLHG